MIITIFIIITIFMIIVLIGLALYALKKNKSNLIAFIAISVAAVIGIPTLIITQSSSQNNTSGGNPLSGNDTIQAGENQVIGDGTIQAAGDASIQIIGDGNLVLSGAEAITEELGHLLIKMENENKGNHYNAVHYYNLGLDYWQRLDYNLALESFRKSKELFDQLLPESDIEQGILSNSIGCLLLDMGKYEEANQYLTSASVVFQKEERNENLTAVRFSIAQYYFCIGDYESMQRMLQLVRDTSGESGKVTIDLFEAKVYDSLGEYDKAIDTYTAILNGLDVDMDYPNDSSLTREEKESKTSILQSRLAVQSSLAAVYLHKLDYNQALEILENAISVSENNVYIGRENLVTGQLYMNLAKAKSGVNRKKEAVEDIDLAMRIEGYLFEYQMNYPGLVEIYQVYGDIKNDKEYYDKAIDLSLIAYRYNHPETADAYFSLASCWMRQGEYRTAMEYIKKSIEIRRNILGLTNPKTVKYYVALAECQKELGEDNSPNIETARMILESLPSVDMGILDNLESVS